MLKAIDEHPYSSLRLYNFESNRDLPRHRWFQFKEGFSADLVKLAVGDVGRRRFPRLLDPFAGSGTTAVEAGFMGLPVTAIEVNPFLRFVISAKCALANGRQQTVRTAINDILETAKTGRNSPLEGVSTFVEDVPTGKRGLFSVEVIRAFTELQGAVRATGPVTKPLELALMAALLDCSNARRDGKCLRYIKGDNGKGASSRRALRTRFQQRGFEVAEDLGRGSFHGSDITLLHGDSRSILRKLESGSHDLVVTSPPYLNSFDYSDVYRPELFAGGYVASNVELRKLRLKTLCSHVQVKRAFSDAVESQLLEPILRRLEEAKLWNKNIPAMVRTYFTALLSKTLRQSVRPR